MARRIKKSDKISQAEQINELHKRLRLVCYFLKLNMDGIRACINTNRVPKKQKI